MIFINRLPTEAILNIVNFFDKESYNRVIIVCKIWNDAFSTEAVQCLKMGLKFYDVDILRGFKADKEIPVYSKNPNYQVFKISKEAIENHEILKAERCISFMREQQQSFCMLRINNYYNRKKDEVAFSYSDPEKLEYFNSDKFQTYVAQSPCKKLKFEDMEII